MQGLQNEAIPKYYEFVESAIWTKKNGQTREVSFMIMENCQGVELIDFLN